MQYDKQYQLIVFIYIGMYFVKNNKNVKKKEKCSYFEDRYQATLCNVHIENTY